MGMWALLLICLSQPEIARVLAQKQTDAHPGLENRDQSWNRQDRRRPVRESLRVDTLPENLTHVVASQRYYLWQSWGPEDARTAALWEDLVPLEQGQVRIHGILSTNHRQAARVALSFNFPFYGHRVRQITIATGGFIFMGEITHRMLTATQYIAPLMANFDPSFSHNSTVRFMDTGNLFVVQWDKVHLQGREEEGAFTFQAALHSNGTIVFNYREVPVPLERINSTEHPVKVGLSDAFMALPPQKTDGKPLTIYEYHRVEINTTKIVTRSAFEFIPLPTCLQHLTCDQCLSSTLTAGCGWCNTLQRCSDGIDRHRQEWLDYNCSEEAKSSCADYSPWGTDATSPPSLWTSSGSTSSSSLLHLPEADDTQTGPPHPRMTENTAIIAGVVAALVVLVVLTLLAVYYINTHPTVAPPFYLMQRRTNNYWPSMKFRNQGCHSTYAEVEIGVHEKEGFIEAEHCC
ncbi:plexin domain-containing protein 1 [Gadus morhua]|uniref:plexin domain-containing protein 1 n=1 Tax=Gadus morhua TaxID=8049 RepID=UPI0011B77150|nr:plexin domain-containing protein 1-like [Gadus morhua]XP_030196413.1 plexin domain-containing protein 1-like [Gadus morhua]